MRNRKLSADVGAPLYRRDGRALVLTAEGRRLAAFGREVQARGSDVLAELRARTIKARLSSRPAKEHSSICWARSSSASPRNAGPCVSCRCRDQTPFGLFETLAPTSV